MTFFHDLVDSLSSSLDRTSSFLQRLLIPRITVEGHKGLDDVAGSNFALVNHIK